MPQGYSRHELSHESTVSSAGDDFGGMRPQLQPALDEARTLAPEELPRLLGDLEEIRTTALARLAAPATASAAPDQSLEVPEAAHRLGVSPDYLYRNHRKFPFSRREGRKVLFSARGIDQYIQSNGRLTPRRHAAILPPGR